MLDTNERQAVTYFVGDEVEHTICFGMKTLFVVGTPPLDEIRKYAIANNCKHIYFGTSQSFEPTNDTIDTWSDRILNFLRDEYWVTLDFDVKYLNFVIASKYCEHYRFVPMISVKMPNIAKLNYNATLKLDDTTWGFSNPGVWTHQVHTLMDPTKYTQWDQYTNDIEIKNNDTRTKTSN